MNLDEGRVKEQSKATYVQGVQVFQGAYGGWQRLNAVVRSEQHSQRPTARQLVGQHLGTHTHSQLELGGGMTAPCDAACTGLGLRWQPHRHTFYKGLLSHEGWLNACVACTSRFALNGELAPVHNGRSARRPIPRTRRSSCMYEVSGYVN